MIEVRSDTDLVISPVRSVGCCRRAIKRWPVVNGRWLRRSAMTSTFSATMSLASSLKMPVAIGLVRLESG
jgi:hypothetical protein